MKLIEIKGDLFDNDHYNSGNCLIVHCVSQDFYMNLGIALTFKNKFKNVEYLLSLKKQIGQVAILEKDSLLIGYLITKKYYYNKPTYESFTNSLMDLLDYYKEKELSCPIIMPRIGCGLDKLEWIKVIKIIEKIFIENNVQVIVYYL